MRLFCHILLFSLSANILFGQVELSGYFEKDTVVIGDEASFTISLMVDEGVEILGVSTFFLDSIYSALQSFKAQTDTTQPLIPVVADYELIDRGGWEDANSDGFFAGEELNWKETPNGRQKLLQKTFILRLWDPGQTVLFYPTVVYNFAGTTDQIIKEEQFTVFVAPPGGLPATQDSLGVAPIKNIQEEPVNFSDYLIYFIIIGLAVLVGLAYWLYSRYLKNKERIKAELLPPVIYIPPHELALEKLSSLRSKELWQKGDIKSYQSELTHIIREYLEGRYNIAALESTTDEIVSNLLRELSDNNDVISLKRILQVADLVKFAKARPENNIHETFMNEAIEFVDRTKRVHEPELEADD